MLSSSITCFLLLISLWIKKADSHVRLTFPPARQHALDYITNVQTKEPCGTPQYPGAPRTKLIEGTVVRVTWDLAFVHRGGIQLQFIKENPIKILVNLTGEQYLFQNDTTRLYADVVIPINLTCVNCTLLLRRQAFEWSASFLYWSCADVTIFPHPAAGMTPCSNDSTVSQSSDDADGSTFNHTTENACFPVPALQFNSCYSGKCLNSGTCDSASGNCSCLRLFSGHRCEFFDRCWSDLDCHNGTCIDTRGTTHPRLFCYCKEGFFGDDCFNESTLVVQDNYENNSLYLSRVLSPVMTIYWRIIGDVIEIVLQARTMSWVSLGWRPISLTDKCMAFPPVESASQIDADFLKFVDSQKGRNTSGPYASVDPEKAIEDALESNIEALCKGGNKSVGRMMQQASPTGEPSSVNAESNNTNNKSNIKSAPGLTGRAHKDGNPLSHLMDCTDIVVGSVKGDLHRVEDMYTKDRSTPRPDFAYNGEDDLTGTAGSQVNGVTTIAFRKKLNATHNSDHTIGNEPMTVIWAIGQEIDNYVHVPTSGLEECTAVDVRFYRHDELKYHGSSSNQRGTATINFMRASVSLDTTTSPPGTTSTRSDQIAPGATRKSTSKKIEITANSNAIAAASTSKIILISAITSVVVFVVLGSITMIFMVYCSCDTSAAQKPGGTVQKVKRIKSLMSRVRPTRHTSVAPLHNASRKSTLSQKPVTQQSEIDATPSQNAVTQQSDSDAIPSQNPVTQQSDSDATPSQNPVTQQSDSDATPSQKPVTQQNNTDVTPNQKPVTQKRDGKATPSQKPPVTQHQANKKTPQAR